MEKEMMFIFTLLLLLVQNSSAEESTSVWSDGSGGSGGSGDGSGNMMSTTTTMNPSKNMSLTSELQPSPTSSTIDSNTILPSDTIGVTPTSTEPSTSASTNLTTELTTPTITPSSPVPTTTLLSTSPPTSTPPASTSPSSPTPTGTTSSAESTTTGSMNVSPEGAEGNDVVVGLVVSILGAVIMVLLVVIIIVLYCLYKHGRMGKIFISSDKYLQFEMSNYGNGGLSMDQMDTTQLFAHIDPADLVSLTPGDLLTHVSDLHQNNGAEDEYIFVKEHDPEDSTSYASRPFNEARNRYINILACDQTRVRLTPIPKVQGSDYINANYIDGYSSAREYIASQGPLPKTVIDFWRMIWEQESAIIVMVTNTSENGMVKCENYWPNRASIQYGNLLVTLEAEQLFAEFIVRSFTITAAKAKKDVGKRTVTQFHFTSWPDFGVPQEPSSMLKFVCHVRSHVTSNQGPMVVHCSAGVGRTGTFIAIDILLQKMRDTSGGLLNVQEVVCRMRAQRGSMVQTSAQYMFIYDSLLHAHTHGISEVHINKLSDHVTSMVTPISEDSDTPSQLDKEFELVMNVKLLPDQLFTAATDDNNRFKNRDEENLPLDENRVRLAKDEDDEESSDYINASYINGYYNRVEFIATQHPLTNTRGDFWRMVTECSVNTIVVFGPIKNSEDLYWPEGEEKLELEEGLIVYKEKLEEEEAEEGRGGATAGEEDGKEEEKIVEEKEAKVEKGKEEVKVVMEEGKEEVKVEEKEEAKVVTEKGKEEVKVEEKEEAKVVTEKGKEEVKEEGKEEVTEKGKEEVKEEGKEEAKVVTEKGKEEVKVGKAEETKVEEEAKEVMVVKEEKEEAKVGKEEGKEVIIEKGKEEAKVEGKEVEGKEVEGKEEAKVVTEKGNEEVKDEGKEEAKVDVGKEEVNLRKEEGKEEAKVGKEEGKEEAKVVTDEEKEKVKVGKEDVKEEVKVVTEEGKEKAKTVVEEGKEEEKVKKAKKTVIGEGELVVRRFAVEVNDVKVNSVVMFHMKDWPAEGVPETTSLTLHLLDESRRHWRETGFNPIVIHTATGVDSEVGGVYCGLCILIRQVEVENAVDVVTTMEKLRQQRPALFTNKDHYKYIYQVMAASIQ